MITPKAAAQNTVVTCENAKLDQQVVLRRKNKVVKKLTMGIAAQLKAGHVTVVSEEAEIAGRTDSGIKVTAGGEEYLGTRLLLATGSTPTLPPIDGLQGRVTIRFRTHQP